MRNFPTSQLLAVIASLVVAAPQTIHGQQLQSDTSSWSDRIPSGGTLSISNFNGHVRVESGDVDEVQVTVIKSWRTGDPDAVSFDIRRYGAGDRNVLICANWKRLTLSCSPGSYAVNNDGSNDTRVDFIVTIPRKLNVSAATVNGNVGVSDVDGAVSGSTVNGNIVVALSRNPDADLHLSSVNGTFASDFDLPINRRLQRGTTVATLGRGGRNISLSTVNGQMKLARL